MTRNSSQFKLAFAEYPKKRKFNVCDDETTSSKRQKEGREVNENEIDEESESETTVTILDIQTQTQKGRGRPRNSLAQVTPPLAAPLPLITPAEGRTRSGRQYSYQRF